MLETCFLVGPRACGKTTLAKHLAAKTGWTALDTDAWILAHYQMTVREIVASGGWHTFRRYESEALHAVTLPRTFVATGGGMILLPENRQFMRENGKVIYLETPPALLCERLQIKPEEDQRPSLTGTGILEEVQTVLQEREPLYRQCADFILCTDQSIADIVKAALQFLEYA